MSEPTDTSRIRSKVSGEGSVLLLLPGLGLNVHIFDELVAKLESDYQCICLDFSGDVEGPAARDCSIDSLTEEVRAWLEENDISPHCVIGHSLGGCIGMKLAIQYPDLVSSLVLISTAAQGDASVFELFMPPNLMSQEELLRRNIEMSVSPSFRNTEAFERIIASQSRFPGTGKCFMPVLRSVSTFDITKSLRRIECPTLIIGGREDAMITPQLSAQLAAGIRASIMITFEKVGHLPQVEVPDQTAVGILSFLKKVVTGLITMRIIPPASQS